MEGPEICTAETSMVDEQLLVRPAEEDRVYPTVVFWKLITLGLAVC